MTSAAWNIRSPPVAAVDERIVLIGAGALARDVVEVAGVDAFCGVYVDPRFESPGLPGLPVEGYEIHMGRVRWLDQPKRQPFRIWEKSLAQNDGSASSFGGESATRGDNRTGTGGESAPEGGSGTVTGTGSGTDRAPGVPEGACTEDGRVWGTFIHGIFHNDDFRRHWLNGIRSDKGLEPVEAALRFRERREAAFGRLAGLARQHLDIGRIYRMTGLREEEDDI